MTTALVSPPCENSIPCYSFAAADPPLTDNSALSLLHLTRHVVRYFELLTTTKNEKRYAKHSNDTTTPQSFKGEKYFAQHLSANNHFAKHQSICSRLGHRFRRTQPPSKRAKATTTARMTVHAECESIASQRQNLPTLHYLFRHIADRLFH